MDRARQEAADAALDLVEVAPDARPPVVRVMDWGKYRFDQQKRAKEARKHQQTIEIKEVKLRPRTDEHDLETKMRHARRFLTDGRHVKVTVRFRGPELRRPDLGYEVLDTVAQALDDLGHVESRSPRLEGRQLSMMVAPD